MILISMFPCAAAVSLATKSFSFTFFWLVMIFLLHLFPSFIGSYSPLISVERRLKKKSFTCVMCVALKPSYKLIFRKPEILFMLRSFLDLFNWKSWDTATDKSSLLDHKKERKEEETVSWSVSVERGKKSARKREKCLESFVTDVKQATMLCYLLMFWRMSACFAFTLDVSLLLAPNRCIKGVNYSLPRQTFPKHFFWSTKLELARIRVLVLYTSFLFKWLLAFLCEIATSCAWEEESQNILFIEESTESYS